jgi:hypothetical protein
MKLSLDTPLPPKHSWTYVRLTVVDGARQLTPAEIAFDRLCFREPPHLTSTQVEIILVNGDQEQRHMDSLPNLRDLLLACASGRELAERGFARDVELATEFDISDAVPVLRESAFVAANSPNLDASPLIG